MNIFIIGILGSGMRGIAELAKQTGHNVYGSDLSASAAKAEMEREGFLIYGSHDGNHLKNMDVVVKSAAVSEENVEVKAARAYQLPIWTRLQALERLLGKDEEKIGIIGSVGKTSTVSIFESILGETRDLTVYMGGQSSATKLYGRKGSSGMAVVELCEYKNAYFDIRADIIVLTDIIENHEDFFGAGIDKTLISIKRFVKMSEPCMFFIPERLKKYFLEFETITFGESKLSDIYLTGSYGTFPQTVVLNNGKNELNLDFSNVIGKHNREKCLPAIYIAFHRGETAESIQKGVKNIKLPKRRLEKKNDYATITTYDDNARNTAQIEKTIEALKERYFDEKIVLFLSIWGRKNRRSISKMVTTMKKNEDIVFILDSLGDASKDFGGSESPEVIHQIIQSPDLSAVDIFEYTSDIELINILRDYNEKKIVFVTCGYDRNLKKFNEIHNLVGEVLGRNNGEK